MVIPLFCGIALLCNFGHNFPDVSVSVWVLWCPILNFGANVLHLHSADMWKTFEGEQVYIMSDIKDNRTLKKIAMVFLIYGKTTKKKKNGQKV